uniref:CSON004716 protein n=2 Tax=Culicoides sonorensis TaxID=179676 RepID=A0A336MVH1_CULSO
MEFIMDDITKNIIFTTNNLQGIQYQTIQAGDVTLKQPKIEKQDFPTFCYVANSNMIQKITPTSQMSNVSTVNLAQLTTDDNKTVQYISQPLGFNYVLNPMQLQNVQNGVNTITVDGRQLIMNKPMTANTISFKCDICNMMFAHLTLLNHHKRSHHSQDGGDSNNDQNTGAITVVTQPQMQNLVQTQDLLGQIQIVATETLEPAQNQTIHQQSEIQMTQHQNQTIQHTTITKVEKTQKCVSCGTQIAQTGKRKGPKSIRCENCIANSDNNQSRPTQIFVAPDGDIKFEIGEIQTDSSGNMEITTQPHQMIQTSNMNAQQQQQQNQSTNTSPQKLPPGAHPVKKRNTGTVTKCNKCNGSGVIFIGAKKTQQQQQNEKPFSCGICGGRFSRYSSLWSHKKLHSGEKNYKCGVCGIAFAKAVYLKNHNRIHTGEKPYNQAAHLKNHEKVHSGIKPFKCDICSAAFADRFALKRHRNIHEKYGQIPPSNPNPSVTKQEEASQDANKVIG